MRDDYFSEHGRGRIKERMKMQEQELVRCIEKRQCLLIATTTGATPEQYIVVWDDIAQKPFLVIVEVFEYVRNIKTAYETWHFHSRKHGVMVLQSHIEKAKLRMPKKDATVDGTSEERVLQVVLIIRQAGTSTRREKLGTISNLEYTRDFGNLETYLDWYIKNSGKEIVIPKNCDVQVDLRRKNKLEILDSISIQVAPRVW